MTWLNQVVQGVLLGGYFAILASGLALLFGVMRIINLAHGDLAVLGAFLVLVLTDHGVDAFVSLAVVLPVMAVGGVLLYRLILERSLRTGVLTPLLSTFGLGIVIENLLFEKFGADQRSINIGSLAYDSWTITSQIIVGKLAVLILVVAVVVLSGLQVFLSRTSLGRAMRATAEDPDTVELVGVNSRAIYALATALALAMAALAGAFLGMRQTFDPYSGPHAAHLRLRGGGDRRDDAVGDARRRHRPRRRPDRQLPDGGRGLDQGRVGRRRRRAHRLPRRPRRAVGHRRGRRRAACGRCWGSSRSPRLAGAAHEPEAGP